MSTVFVESRIERPHFVYPSSRGLERSFSFTPTADVTFPANQLMAYAGNLLVIPTAAAARTLTLPAAQDLVNLLWNDVGSAPSVGDSLRFRVTQLAGTAATLAVGTGITGTLPAPVTLTKVHEVVLTFTAVASTGSTATVSFFSSA